jgi:predicted PurR-regulated permease PerM
MVVVFICGLIPMVGHTIGAIIVTLVALFHSVSSAVIILAYYILYQQIENYLIQPRIQANTTNMSPLLVFAAVLVGVSFGGLFGGLVAIPVAGCIRIALLEYLRSRHIIGSSEFKQATTEETK